MKKNTIILTFLCLISFLFISCIKISINEKYPLDTTSTLTNDDTTTQNDTNVITNFDPSTLKTMEQVFVYKNENEYNYQSGYGKTYYTFVFKVNNNYYRAVAKLPKDVSDKLWSSWPEDIELNDRDKIIEELVGPLPISTFENLTEKIPPQNELDKLVGKKGKELFDDGWYYTYYNVIDMEAGLNHGDYYYLVKFNYDGPQMENTDDFDFYKEFADLTVKSIKVEGIGDAVEIKED